MVPAEFIESFQTMQTLVHQNAKAKGWWDSPREDGTCIALMHSELSEALEALRSSDMSDDYLCDDKLPGHLAVEVELADVVIRIMDYAQARSFDVAHAIVAKHEYNLTRSHRHGGKSF